MVHQAVDWPRVAAIVDDDLQPVGVALVDHALDGSPEQYLAILRAGDDTDGSIHG